MEKETIKAKLMGSENHYKDINRTEHDLVLRLTGEEFGKLAAHIDHRPYDFPISVDIEEVAVGTPWFIRWDYDNK